jgi:uncharacterized coiled-coil protein SlyX
MLRTSFVCVLGLLAWSSAALAQSEEFRIDQLEAETAQLKATVAEQGRRITELENMLKALQAVLTPTPKLISALTPAWYEPSKWTLLRAGMSEAQVVEILGPPSNVDAEIDFRTLLYETGSSDTRTLIGSVTLVDDRVTAAQPPKF